MAGKNYGVYRRRPDYRKPIYRKPITILRAPKIPVLRLANIFLDRVLYKRRTDYLRHTRRIKPVTITKAVIRTALLRLTSTVFLNRAIYRREYDYYIRNTRRIMPITITAAVNETLMGGGMGDASVLME